MRSNEVQFDGWSRAAWRFRILAALRARKERRVLIVGESGTPVERMAHAWAAAAGKLKVVDVDKEQCPNEKFVGFSSCEPRHALQSAEFVNLETGRYGRPIKADPNGSASWAKSNFTLQLYMPPLRQRTIDVFALLYYLKNRTGRRWKCGRVSLSLLRQALSEAEWLGNEAQADDYFRQAALATKNDCMVELPGVGVFANDRNLKSRYMPKNTKRRNGTTHPNGSVHEELSTGFAALPTVAISTMCAAWATHGLDDMSVGYSAIGGSWRLWPTKSIRQLAKLLKGTRFLEHLFLPVDSRPGWNELLREMANVEAFGASFSSLAAGFDVRRKLKREASAKAKRTGLTDRETEILEYIKVSKDSGRTQRHLAKQLRVTPAYLSQVKKKAGVQRNSKSARRRTSKSVRTVSSSRLDLLGRNDRSSDGDALEDDHLG